MKSVTAPPEFIDSKITRVVDSSAILTEAQLETLWAHGVRVIGVYTRHPTMHDQDATRAYVQRLTTATAKRGAFAFWLIQYYRNSGHDAATGASDGANAKADAEALGLPAGAWSVCDGEASRPGDLVAYDPAWAAAAGKSDGTTPLPVLYDAQFLTTAEKDASGFAVFWRSGMHTPHAPTVGYALEQGQQTTIGGVVVDPSTVRRDALGRLPVFAAGDTWTAWDLSEPTATSTTALPSTPATPRAFSDPYGSVYPPPSAGRAWKLVVDANDDEIGAFIASCAKPWAGLSDAPGTRVAFRDVVGPLWLEGPSLSAAMAGSWCCAETGEGLLRAILRYASDAVKLHLRAFLRYVIGQAMVDAQRDAETLGCLRHPRDGLPRQGSSVLIDNGYHDVSCVVGVPVEGQPVDTVEGGNCIVQGGVRYMSISAGQRVLHASGAIASADGKTHHTEYVWLDWIAGMRGAAKIDPELRILVDAPPPPPIEKASPAPEAPPQVGATPVQVVTSPAGTSSAQAHSLQLLMPLLLGLWTEFREHWVLVVAGIVATALVAVLVRDKMRRARAKALVRRSA